MFKRLFATDARAPAPDALSVSEGLTRARGAKAQAEEVLKALKNALAGDVRGYVVAGDDTAGYHFEAQVGYDDALLDLPAGNGPWRSVGPRVVPNLVAELFTSNDPEARANYGDLGMRGATTALVVPVVGRYERHGALVLQRHGSPAFNDDDVKLAARWAAVLGDAHGQALELRMAKLSLVQFTRAFVQAFESSDFAQLGHGERVTAYALAMGRAMGLSRARLADLYFAAMLHDIGKLGNGLDPSIEDLEHPQRGANMVAVSELLAPAAEGVRHHHEAWDGTGFPDGLRKEDIPLLARIVAVADTFDLLSSERGQALPLRDVEKALEAHSGKSLDPAIVSLLMNVLRQGRNTQELSRLNDDDLPF
ncbi:MAG: HD domain-containing phosphohydrolase [Trueperaceae bacterium]|nr:HD domain-containing protein [Truepera sp.]HRN19382.1 HD domain-containing protein [Trueperaceae bacterium]HRQ10271.1 HD domain-containing protein [Trueperaceae bacterium]